MRALTIAVMGAWAIGSAWAQAPSGAASPSPRPAAANQAKALVPVAGPSGRTPAILATASDRKAVTTNQPAGTYVGEITGSNVNVRSGSDANYYAVIKLQRGDRIKVLGHEFGWAKIEPPAGCFSLIDRRFVDRAANNAFGVVNGDNVRVYAGSTLVDRKYGVQVQLSRGAEVEILGEDKESGFYKIKPPRGAALWVSADYVKRATGPARRAVASGTKAVPAPRQSASGTGNAIESPATVPPKSTDAVKPDDGEVPVIASLQALPEGPARDELSRIEAAVIAERRKAPVLQDFGPYVARLEQLAASAEEPVAKIYAEHRAKQLASWMKLIQDVRRVRQQGEALPPMKTGLEFIPGAIGSVPFDVEGELRKSQVFSSRALPTYYRLVDPSRRPARTVAYLQLPEGETIDLDKYLGQYVRVRAAERRRLGTVGRSIPLIIPAEIGVVVDDDEPATEPASTTAPPVSEPVTTSEEGNP